MREHVPVRVAGKATRVVDDNATEHEGNALLEGVRVVSDPHPQLHQSSEANACGSDARSATLEAASGGVGWSLPHGPRRTCTATRPAAAAGSTSLSTRSPT